jgi:hypothetical protein
MSSAPLFHLPTAPPRLILPSTIWVPARWRLLRDEDLEAMSSVQAGHVTKVAQKQLVGFPWLLLSSSSIPVSAPSELFLRSLRGLDVSDDEALANWCGDWGVPSVPAFLTAQGRDPVFIGGEVIDELPGRDRSSSPEGTRPKDRSVANGGIGAAGTPWRPGDSSLRKLLKSQARHARAGVQLDDVVFRVSNDDLDAVPLTAARFALGLRQALTELFVSVPRSPSLDDLNGFDAKVLGRIWAPTGLRPVALQGRRDPLLESLLLGLEVLNAMAADAQAWTVGITDGNGATLAEPRRSVGDLLAIELTKFLADHAMVKCCERCGQQFLRQTGRAKSDQYRVTGGVRYCSVQCSQAAQSKAYRDRRAAQRASHRGGGGQQPRE